MVELIPGGYKIMDNMHVVYKKYTFIGYNFKKETIQIVSINKIQKVLGPIHT